MICIDMEVKRICIIYPNKTSSSETFIKAHVDHLPGEIKVLYGGWFPKFSDGDKLIIQKSPVCKLLEGLERRVFNGKSKPVNQRLEEMSLLKYFEENKIDVVLAEYGPTGVAVMNVCKQAKIKLIVHFHGFDAYHFETLEKYKASYQELFQKANAIVAVSTDMKNQLISLGASREKVHYNPYGVDVKKFFPGESLADQPIFLFVGRFVNKKAPHFLIIAMAKVLEKIPEAKLYMIGDGGLGGSGELLSACKQMVKGLGLDQSVRFFDAMTQDAIANEMRNVFAYVQHSVKAESGDSEGTPNSVLEACASGLPVIATRHAGIKDVITDGVTGFLVDEYDINGMTERMIALASNKQLAYSMGKASRSKIENHFRMDQAISKLYSIIESN
jgi:colanic acid/amylovoran biosynthesis glycosyltransferase